MRKQYVDFLDRFDGGGAGQTGNSFQGGGLLSALANIFANPYGSEDQARRAQRRQALGLLDTAAAAPARAPAPFAPRTAPQVVPSHLTGPKMGMPPIPSHLTGPKMGMPPIPAHLTGPKMGMPPPAPSPLGALDEVQLFPPTTGAVQSSYQSVPNLNDGMPMLADPSGVGPAMPYNDSPVPVQTDMPTAARHTPPSNFTDEDYVMMAAQNPAFETWLMGQPGGLSLPDQAKRFLNLQLINQARQ